MSEAYVPERGDLVRVTLAGTAYHGLVLATPVATPGTDEMIVVFLGNGLTLNFAAGELGPVPLGHGSLVTSNFAGVMREG